MSRYTEHFETAAGTRRRFQHLFIRASFVSTLAPSSRREGPPGGGKEEQLCGSSPPLSRIPGHCPGRDAAVHKVSLSSPARSSRPDHPPVGRAASNTKLPHVKFPLGLFRHGGAERRYGVHSISLARHSDRSAVWKARERSTRAGDAGSSPPLPPADPVTRIGLVSPCLRTRRENTRRKDDINARCESFIERRYPPAGRAISFHAESVVNGRTTAVLHSGLHSAKVTEPSCRAITL